MITQTTKNIDFQREVKVKYNSQDIIVLFRIGDFYKVYNEDSLTLSRDLGITRTFESEDKCYTACFPAYRLNEFLPRIIRKGHRVCICDQVV